MFSPWQGMKWISSIIIIFVSIFVVLPESAYCEFMWKVDKKTLQYTYHATIIHKIQAFYRYLLRTHRLEYQITIQMNQIEYIAVTYAKVPRLPYGAYGYDVWFRIHMYDGSIFSFILLTLSGKEDFNRAIDFMKNQVIYFKDGYYILDALYFKEHLSSYLERLEKEQLK